MLTPTMSAMPRVRVAASAILKAGMSGDAVRRLALDLATLGYLPSNPPYGMFDREMEAAVRRFQVKGIGGDGRPLKVDGVVGPKTRFGLGLALGDKLEAPNTCLPPPPAALGTLPPGVGAAGWRALQAALAEIEDGAQEIGAPGCGPYCARYLAAAGRSQPQDWSTAFVAWCLGESGIADASTLVEKACWLGWESPETTPVPGDVLIWTSELGDGFCGHAAIVAWFADELVHTVEGGRTPFVEFFHYDWSMLSRIVTVVRPKTRSGEALEHLRSMPAGTL